MSSLARTSLILARAAAAGLTTYLALLAVEFVLVLGFFIDATRAYERVLGWTFGLDGRAWISALVAAIVLVIGVRSERMRSSASSSTAPGAPKVG